MKILIIEPFKPPRPADIDGRLSTLQKIVGGTIQAIYPYDDPVALICNDEGKLLGLPLNRSIEDYDIIAGTFIICGLGEDCFAPLSSELEQKYKEKFLCPEIIITLNGKLVALKISPSHLNP